MHQADVNHCQAPGRRWRNSAIVWDRSRCGPSALRRTFLIYKDRSPFVHRHALESLNFQLTLLIGSVTAAVLMLVLIGSCTEASVPATAPRSPVASA